MKCQKLPQDSIITARPDWQQQLAQAITDPLQLLDILGLDASDFPNCQLASQDFQLKVTHSYLEKIRPGDKNDPLLRQIMSNAQELIDTTGYHPDPVGELDAMATPGLLHKYHGRVLLVTTAACAIHCRYCFRRHFPYQGNQPSRQQWQASLDYIQQHRDIQEVILSGGDPLVLSDAKLAELLQQLDNIKHLKWLRLHSRLPVVLADRINDALIATLGTSRLQVSLVIHANHSQEIAANEIAVLQKLKQSGITLLNQSVLLKNVNDSAEQLINLSETLYQAGVLPYYLHLLDPVKGAAHFNVDQDQAIKLINQIRCRLPGYLVPKLVREIAGEKSKTPIFEL